MYQFSQYKQDPEPFEKQKIYYNKNNNKLNIIKKQPFHQTLPMSALQMFY